MNGGEEPTPPLCLVDEKKNNAASPWDGIDEQPCGFEEGGHEDPSLCGAASDGWYSVERHGGITFARSDGGAEVPEKENEFNVGGR
ncbi:hypothetical protein L1887_20606 [Cichorium endivia]|nr:hypothetical protein L1887_20606 [Cichorium endivia]